MTSKEITKILESTMELVALLCKENDIDFIQLKYEKGVISGNNDHWQKGARWIDFYKKVNKE